MKTFAHVLALSLLAGSASLALANDDNFSATLSGYNEVHFIAAPTPALRGAISTTARGRFEARIDDHKDIISYELSYEGLTTDVTQAHIHFGQRHTVGGIVVWLCQTALVPAPATVAALTPTCPGPTSGTVKGTITPAQVLEAVGQGIAAGEFEEVVAAIRAGRAYANVHSTTFAPGEIRGQIHDGRGRH
ncbi:MAG TPA: CHRD domain-containing protein [Methylomirabilota bacterium]|jgi:CHRD domain|nr:CHRD domain-containing protein [Methylomirabilota bacterium]